MAFGSNLNASFFQPMFGLLSVVLSPSLFFSAGRGAEVVIGSTTIIGNESSGLEFFGGIPYATAQRFSLPEPKFTLDETTFDASDFGSSCIQWPVEPILLSRNPEGGPPQDVGPQSEDCLFINVLRPAGVDETSSLPVMLWIHGGGFAGGSSTTFPGNNFVAQSIARGTPVIYVSFNYRLGLLGFPYGREAAEHGVLNLGLKDQLVAIEWVNRNIGAFGGNKDQVTLFGESAGAISVAIQLLNPDIEKYARAAILQSGAAGSIPLFNGSHGQAQWDTFVSSIPGCSPDNGGFECLQATPLENIVTAADAGANANSSWYPVIDGPSGLIPELPSDIYVKGLAAKIPFLSGCNLDEGTLFTPSTTTSSKSIEEFVMTFYLTGAPGNAAELERASQVLMRMYPDIPFLGSPYDTGNETFGMSTEYKRTAAATGDFMFQSGRRQLSQLGSRAGIKHYAYHFTDAPPTSELQPKSYGVSHAMDVFYMFGQLASMNGTAEALELAKTMRDYWISFATTLDPNDGIGGNRTLWPQYTPDDPVLLELNSKRLAPVPDDYRRANIDYINSHSALFRR